MRNRISGWTGAVRRVAAVAAVFAALAGAIFAFGGGAEAGVIDGMRLSITFPTEVDDQVPPGRQVPVDIRITTLLAPSSGNAITNACIASTASANAADLNQETDVTAGALTTLHSAAISSGECQAGINAVNSWITLPAGSYWLANAASRINFRGGVDAVLNCPVANGDAGAEVEVYCRVETASGDLPVIDVPANFERDEIVMAAKLTSAAAADNSGVGDFYLAYTDGTDKKLGRGASIFNDTARLGVSSINEVATVRLTFERAPNLGTVVASRNERVQVRLGVLNENGRAADPSAVLSVTLISTVGSVSSPNAPQLCASASNVCTFTATQLKTQVTTSSDPSLPASIPLQWQAPAEPGEGTLTAQVLGEISGLVETDPITLHVPGPVRTYEIAAPKAVVHYKHVGSDGGGALDSTDRAANARDELRLKITALDAANGPTAMPRSVPTSILGPGGARIAPTEIAAGIEDCDSSGATCVLVIDVDAVDGVPLGDYQVVVGSGTTSANRAFQVGGDASELTVEWSPESDTPVGSRITFTATVADADGRPVADGTPVAFLPIPDESVLFKGPLSNPLTAGGKASQVLTVVKAGLAILSVRVDVPNGPTKTPSINTGARTPVAPVCGYESLSSAQGGLATWTGAAGCMADDLLGSADAIRAIWTYSGGRWLAYSATNGAPLPGALNFNLLPNAQLWVVR